MARPLQRISLVVWFQIGGNPVSRRLQHLRLYLSFVVMASFHSKDVLEVAEWLKEKGIAQRFCCINNRMTMGSGKTKFNGPTAQMTDDVGIASYSLC